MDRVNNLTPDEQVRASVENRAALIDPLYRKPTREEATIVAIDPSIRRQYERVLAKDNTGIIRLLPDEGCESAREVISAATKCNSRYMPGFGSSYSFRRQTYSVSRMADIQYANGSLTSPGEMSQAAFVILTDIDMGDVTIDSSQIAALINAPLIPKNSESALPLSDFGGGAKLAVNPKVGDLYALRSIAFRGAVKRSTHGITYNELDYDKRRDITLVFQIAAIDSTNGIFIVWRQLRNTESPKAK